MLDPGLTGREGGPYTYEYGPGQTGLHALALGLDPASGPAACFGLEAARRAVRALRAELGLPLNGAVHVGQSIEVVRSLPVNGPLFTTARLTGVFDKGRAALITADTQTRDPQDRLVMEASQALLFPGLGGFGGHRGAPPAGPAPGHGPPELEIGWDIPENAAALYRLLGDLNPLHIDPASARRLGFDRPILHGLATLGWCLGALERRLGQRLVRARARFGAPVFPGGRIGLHAWPQEGRARPFSAMSQGRQALDGEAVFQP